jgi:hypothetical protein
VNCFVSHAGSDQVWAEWLSQQLTAEGYSVELDIWDWAPGDDFVSAMAEAMKRADRLVAVLTPHYFARPFAHAEYRAAFATRTQGGRRRIVPVLVEPCEVPDIYATLVPIDLVTAESEEEARRRLIAGMDGPSGPPTDAVPFPGGSRSDAAVPLDGRVTFPGSLPEVWRVPPRNPSFTGREVVLAELRRRLAECGTLALRGGGGVGKTQVATEYAWRHVHHYEMVWWANAGSAAELATDLAALADCLQIAGAGVPVAVRAGHALRHLHHCANWLLIYDNAEPSIPRELWPPPTGELLLTSREPAVARLTGHMIEIDDFNRSESLDLIRRHLPDMNIDEAGRLADGVGDLPLAVEQAAAFVVDSGLTIADYLHLLNSHPDMAGLGEPTGDQHAGLAAIVSAGRARLDHCAPEAGEFLDSVAFFAPTPIRLGPSADASGAVVPGGPAVIASIVRHSCRLGLARRVGAGLVIHRLVQLLLRSRMTPDQRSRALVRALDLLGTTALADPDAPAAWPAYRRLVPHIEAVTGGLGPGSGITEPETFRVTLLGTIRYLFVTGNYLAARELSEKAHERWAVGLGEDHPDTVRAISHLAAALRALGDGARALDLKKTAYERTRRLLGPEHPDTLWAANNLAVSWFELGEIERAYKLDEVTYGAYRKVLGADHPDTLRSANNLGADLRALGHPQRAYELDLDTFTRRRRLFGKDHPDAMWSANNMALSLHRIGRRTQARALLADTLERRQRVLGPDHPETRRTADNLAQCLEG